MKNSYPNKNIFSSDNIELLNQISKSFPNDFDFGRQIRKSFPKDIIVISLSNDGVLGNEVRKNLINPQK